VSANDAITELPSLHRQGKEKNNGVKESRPVDEKEGPSPSAAEYRDTVIDWPATQIQDLVNQGGERLIGRGAGHKTSGDKSGRSCCDGSMMVMQAPARARFRRNTAIREQESL